MKENFSHCELLDIAVSIEENGKDFYCALMRQAKDEEMKTMWRFLADKETEHKKIFASLLSNAAECVILEYGDDEYHLFLKAVSENYVFTKEAMQKTQQEALGSGRKAVELAIAMEKESILVYTLLKDVISADKQKTVDRIIAEEKKHWAILERIKRSLEKKGV